MSTSIISGCAAQANAAAEQPESTTVDTTTEPPTEAITQEPFALSIDNLTLVNQGEAWSIYDGPRDKTKILWGSENEAVATILDGMVIAVGEGETTVYALVDGQRHDCKVVCQLQDLSDDPRAPVLVPPATQVVDASFFDDAAFIGDSVSVGLGAYASYTGDLGKATFLARTSYGISNAVYDIMLMFYRGREYKIEDALGLCQPGKIFVMLGTNDVGGYDHDLLIKRWGMFLDRVRSACPDTPIYIISVPPVWTGGEKGRLTNWNVDSFNLRLERFAVENGCAFIDTASYLKDSTGGLARPYCSDKYVHFTNKGCQAVIQILKSYTGYNKTTGETNEKNIDHDGSAELPAADSMPNQ